MQMKSYIPSCCVENFLLEKNWRRSVT